MPPTLPPSTLSTDPFVAEDNGLDKYAIAFATSDTEAKRPINDEPLDFEKNSSSTSFKDLLNSIAF